MSYAAFLDVLPSYAVPFFSLSYPVAPPKNPDSFPDSNYYNYGILDVCVVISGIAVMAILRDILRLFVFEPFGRWVLQRQLNSRKRKLANGNDKTNGAANGVNGNANGHAKLVNTRKETRVMEHSVMRFSEQGWPVIYYPLQWAFGLYIHMNLPHHNFDLTHLWIDYPHTHLAGPLKLYYLTQAAFYTHQILILNAEEHRKDHWQMMTHHIITVFLMLQSYTYHFTRVGCLMMVLMDCSDIFLPLAKMMRYLNIRQLFCDTVFGAFLVSWLITRHYLSILVIKSALFDVPNLLTFGWEPERGFYLTYGVYVMFNLCLLALQVLQIMWFATICRVAYKVLVGQGASDTRSDDEGGDDEKED